MNGHSDNDDAPSNFLGNLRVSIAELQDLNDARFDSGIPAATCSTESNLQDSYTYADRGYTQS